MHACVLDIRLRFLARPLIALSLTDTRDACLLALCPLVALLKNCARNPQLALAMLLFARCITSIQVCDLTWCSARYTSLLGRTNDLMIVLLQVSGAQVLACPQQQY